MTLWVAEKCSLRLADFVSACEEFDEETYLLLRLRTSFLFQKGVFLQRWRITLEVSSSAADIKSVFKINLLSCVVRTLSQ